MASKVSFERQTRSIEAFVLVGYDFEEPKQASYETKNTNEPFLCMNHLFARFLQWIAT